MASEKLIPVVATPHPTQSRRNMPTLTPCCEPILGTVLSAEEANELALALKALADPVRLRLVSLVATAGEACACDFPGILGKSQPTISHHLTLLVKAGILQREQRGKWAWFRVNEDQMESIRTTIGPRQP